MWTYQVWCGGLNSVWVFNSCGFLYLICLTDGVFIAANSKESFISPAQFIWRGVQYSTAVGAFADL